MWVAIDYRVEESQNAGQIGHSGLDCFGSYWSMFVRIIILCDPIGNRKRHGDNPYGAARDGERFYHFGRWRAGC